MCRLLVVLLAAAVLVAAGAAAASAAVNGTPLRGGARNPAHSAAFTRQTQIAAKTKTSYALSVFNTGFGGAATLACGNIPAFNIACLNAHNLSTGLAFDFSSRGATGGRITLRDPSGSPLVTNATGIAYGFNADRVDGKSASDFLGADQPATDSAKLGGRPASDYALAGQLMFAVVSAGGQLQASRGATIAHQNSATEISVGFTADVSRCSYTASPIGSATDQAIGVALDANPTHVVVSVPAPSPGFHLQVIC